MKATLGGSRTLVDEACRRRPLWPRLEVSHRGPEAGEMIQLVAIAIHARHQSDLMQ